MKLPNRVRIFEPRFFGATGSSSISSSVSMGTKATHMTGGTPSLQ